MTEVTVPGGTSAAIDGGSPGLLDELRVLLGPRLASDSVHRRAYARDAYPLAIKASVASAAQFVPLAVAWPETTDEVTQIARMCGQHGVPLIAYGGGSGIVGGALSQRQSLILDTKRMNRIRAIDPVSLTATIEAGALGTLIERELAGHGLTTGHYPQSLHSSTLGGWLAHRGIGTYSTLYGRIEDMVLGLEVVLADGSILSTKPVPATAAGPDLARLFMGSEGTFGIITAATLRLVRLPEMQSSMAFATTSFDTGLDVIRRVVQGGYRPAVARLYDPLETAAQFGELGLSPDQAMLLTVSEGPAGLVAATEMAIGATARDLGATELGPEIAHHWFQHRFSTAGLCQTLSREGGIADALEVANDWTKLGLTYQRMLEAMRGVVGPGGRVFGHVSHVYGSGANLYMIFHAFAEDDSRVGDRYQDILEAAFEACLATGGTLTHHHGVGLAKAQWMASEVGPTGMAMLSTIKAALDPAGIMNPGRLGLA